ncbi:MAG: hypothetical protein N2A42_06570, partial [Luteolibacter sp.]
LLHAGMISQGFGLAMPENPTYAKPGTEPAKVSCPERISENHVCKEIYQEGGGQKVRREVRPCEKGSG